MYCLFKGTVSRDLSKFKQCESCHQIEWNLQILAQNNTANTKEGTDGQT